MLKTIYFPREFGMFFSSCESGVWTHTANIWERSAQNKTTLETAHTISLISPTKSSYSSSTSNSDPTSSISMSVKLVLRVEWNETVRTRRDPFDTKKFSNFSPEILVEWNAPPVSLTQVYSSCSSVHKPLPKWEWLWAMELIICASYTVELPRQRNSYQFNQTFLCFESPTITCVSA